MKSEAEIRLTKESTEQNINNLWDCHKFYVAHEETIKLNVLKWVLDEPIDA